ncbi:MAG: hypothetical protein ABWY00_00755 [Dongiaceae bacterium]
MIRPPGPPFFSSAPRRQQSVTAGIATISSSFNAAEMPSGTATFNVIWYVGAVSGPAVAG